MEYRENPACLESRTPSDVLNTFSKAEKKAFHTLTDDEIEYLRDQCGINEYVEHLRKGRENKALGEDFPVLVIKGSKLQLERYKIIFLLSLIDYNGINYYYPSDFALGEEALNELRKFTGVAIVRIAKGTATSEGLDAHRSELIAGVVATRRDFFNPTLILAEESIAGKLTVSSDLIRVVFLDPTRLSSSYDGTIVTVNTESASRVKTVATTYTPPTTSYKTSVLQSSGNNYNKSYQKKGKNSDKVSTLYLAKSNEEAKRQEQEEIAEMERRARAEGRM